MFPDKEADVANTLFCGDSMPKKQMPLWTMVLQINHAIL